MARRGRPTVPITLSADERDTLQRWSRRHSSSQALALRCRIVLACAEGDRTRDEVAAEVGCNPATVTKWRHRFAADRLDGLVDAPRPGCGPHHRRRRDRGGGGRDAGDRSGECDPLVDSGPGGQARDQPPDGGGDLARLRAQALAPGQLQSVTRPRAARRSVTWWRCT